jgi:rfaE bifunctional protein kinase chain/domain
MDAPTLERLLAAFPSLRIAVVGDLFLDKYLVIDPSLAEPSVETGLEAHQVVAKRLSPGAAGTVMSNLSALDVGTLYAVSVVGRDGEGFELKEGLAQRRVNLDYLIETPHRFTPTYTKPMRRQRDGSEVEMNRVDIKNRTPTPPALESAIVERLREVVERVDGVVALDQVSEPNTGVITSRVREEIRYLAESHPKVIFFGDARAHIGAFRSIILKPNQHEAVRAIHPDAPDDVPRDVVRASAEQLARRTSKPVYVTLGGDGILVFNGEDWTHVPTIRVEGPIDIVGAGDSTTAGIVSSLCAGASLTDAAIVGNIVASITIQQLGTTGTASRQEVRERFDVFRNAVIT